MNRLVPFAMVLLASFSTAYADEGMWTLNGFPSDRVAKTYGFRPDQAWLTHVRQASVRLAQGCSGSFVSPDGLVMTNHHCAHRCIEQLSTLAKDLDKNGFYAKSRAEEPKCPELEVNQLIDIRDVSDTVHGATKGLDGKAFHDAQKAITSKLEAECQTSDSLRCEVVTLFHGGRYDLYTYRRYQEVRLVFAPEFAVAFFGGDPDNFMFPRYDLDVSFVRVYQDGKPAHINDYFTFSPVAPKSGDLTFVSGHPGRTAREQTTTELAYQRDFALVDRLIAYAELRGVLTEYQHRGAEQKRHSTAMLFGVENSIKAMAGMLDSLRDHAFFASKVREEEAFKAKLAKGDNAKANLEAFAAIGRAEDALTAIRVPLRYLEYGEGFGGKLFSIARMLLRGPVEREKANAVRLEEFADAALPQLTQSLFSPAPIYPELETLRLSHSFTKLREVLGADDPIVKKVLGQASPDELAEKLVKGTALASVAERRRLWDGGRAVVDASTDPMIALARLIDDDARAVRKKSEEEIDAVVKKNEELLAKARFDIYGTSVYPDATFSLRLSYGQVKGWDEGARHIEPLTTFAGAFARATGRDPFALPASWLSAQQKIDPATVFDIATTNDIIGGNSGSPVVNKNGEAVGLIFDGNIWSLGGDYGFDESKNRAVAVSTAAIFAALKKIYGADRIAAELVPAKPATK